MRFIIFVIDTASNTGNQEEMRAIDAFNSNLQSHDQLVMAAGISSSAKALLIDNRSGLGAVSPSSLNGTDFYSGFWIINAGSEEEAKEIALGASQACNRRVELRPFLGK